jgi:hypothetical protein
VILETLPSISISEINKHFSLNRIGRSGKMISIYHNERWWEESML